MKILFVYQALSTFVQKDLDILRSVHEVQPVQFTGPKGLGCNFFQDLWQLWQGVLWCDLTFSWFGKLHAFFAVLFSKILGKKSAIIAGGDDATKYIVAGKPYGLFAHPIKKWFAFFTFRCADLVLPVSKFTLKELFQYVNVNPEKTKLVYHGFDSNLFKRLPAIKKNRLVVTVGDVSKENVYRKGYKLIVEAAALLGNIQVAIIGPWVDDSILELKKIAPKNVTFTNGLYDKALIEFLSRASVYIQASEWESFGCALAEAMLCECTPVVSRRTSLQEVVNDCGFYVENLDPNELAMKIHEALRALPEMGQRARQRIMEKFPLEKRRQELLAAIASLEKR